MATTTNLSLEKLSAEDFLNLRHALSQQSNVSVCLKFGDTELSFELTKPMLDEDHMDPNSVPLGMILRDFLTFSRIAILQQQNVLFSSGSSGLDNRTIELPGS